MNHHPNAFKVTYEYNGSPEDVKKVFESFNSALKGNSDYIDGAIECHYRYIYIAITVFTIRAMHLPDFLKSNEAWFTFVDSVLMADYIQEV